MALTDNEIGYSLSLDFGASAPGRVPPAFAELHKPNDPMDWAAGLGAVGVGYTAAYLYGGPPGVVAYAAAAPDFVLFGGAVISSNLLQMVSTSRGGRYSTYSPTVTSGFMMV